MATQPDKGEGHKGKDPGQTASEAAESAQERASRATEKAQEEASRLSERAKEQISSQAEQQKHRATDQLQDLGSALRETSSTLHDEDQDSIANVVEGAAHQVERLSRYLRSRSMNEMISEAEQVARREPAMFLGGAALLGFIGARFFKSSDPDPPRPPRHRRRRLPAETRPRQQQPRESQGRGRTSRRERIRSERPQPVRSESRRPETGEEQRPSSRP